MAVGTAWQVAGAGRALARAIVLTLVIVGAAPALSQDKVEKPLAAPALSSACEAPAGDIATPGPLPRVARALAERRSLRVLSIGSSPNVGIVASTRRSSYPAQLEDILERTIKGVDVDMISRGVSGEVAATTAERLKMQVASLQPDLVLWQIGTNDALSRVPVEAFEATARDGLRWLREHGIDVVLVGLQYTPSLAKDGHYIAIKEALRKLAFEENVLLVRRFEAMQFIAATRASGSLLAGDDVQINDSGYRCMAEHVARALVLNAFAQDKKDARP